uniref:Serine/threonine-protein phosphatase n=1 Tax=Panagrellus redivivus TaxID=6233 RepID=A0A7E4VIY3_PANRE
MYPRRFGVALFWAVLVALGAVANVVAKALPSLKCASHVSNSSSTFDHCKSGSYCFADSGGIRGCADKSKCDDDKFQDYCDKVTSFCCCKSNLCNVNDPVFKSLVQDHPEPKQLKPDEANKNAPKTVPIVLGCTGALIGVTALIVGAAFLVRCIMKKRAKTNLDAPSNEKVKVELPNDYDEAGPVDISDESPPKDSAKDSSLLKDVEKSVSIPKPTPTKSKVVNVVHVDHTDVHVPADLKKEERKALLKSLKKQPKLKAISSCEQAAVITKVLTYCTDDDITGGERSSRETNEEISSSANTDMEVLLQKLIANGPRQYTFSYDELKNLLQKAERHFEKECSMLEVPVPVTVYGDIHGQYSDLHRWFNLNGWPHQTRSVFLGDFVDRGSHGVEVVALLSCLKLIYPDRIFIVRGNHEEESLNRAYSFYEEVLCRFSGSSGKDGIAMYNHFKNLFMQLPLAVLIGGRVLGMHGGLSPKMESLQAIRDIKRPIDDFEVGSLECDLVWSDPDTGADTGFRPNFDREPNNGIGQLFAADTVKQTCDKLNIDLIIRGHQAPLHGYALFADGRLLTLFSAPGYKGTALNDVNMGACLEFDRDMRITIKQIKVSERFRQNRVNDCEKVRIQRKEHRRMLARTERTTKRGSA